jgi:hypothetical protein
MDSIVTLIGEVRSPRELTHFECLSALGRLLKNGSKALRRPQGERKSPMELGRGSAHAEPFDCVQDMLVEHREGFFSSLLTLSGQVIPEETTAVLVVVTIDTEVLPVASVAGVVVVVAIPMMHRQQMEIRLVKLARALGTDPAMQFK